MDRILGLLNRMNTRRGIPMGDFASAYLSGSRVDPRGGTYMPFEEPLETQYGSFESPFVESLFTPEVMRIMDEVRKENANNRLDQNWQDQKWNWPMRGVGGLGSQIAP